MKPRKMKCKNFYKFADRILMGISARNDKNGIWITLTGWANIKKWVSWSENIYTIPYSSHSNWAEIEMFVKAICPAKLVCVVQDHSKRSTMITHMKDAGSYMSSLKNMKQGGFPYLVNHYVDPMRLSTEYKKWTYSKSDYNNLRLELGVYLTPEQELAKDKKDFER
jgi:hypothetical protein